MSNVIGAARSPRCWTAALAVSTLALAAAYLAGFGPDRATAAEAEVEQVDEPISYAREVQPILASACFACHGFDANAREADLRLDNADDAYADRGDHAAITPGDPEASEAYRRITADDPAERMPPQSHHHQLSDEDIAVIRRWIEQGAEYENHWAFIAPESPDLPAVEDADWPENAVDHFVLAELQQHDLSPSPSADRETLVRRVTLDLTGLPPTPEEVDAFLDDEADGAYERLVDRLLASPRYGEHMARYWLDAVRYGDTHGLHLDNYREMWPYRDWVIRAFNDNKPFDVFVTEQLAGDLLPEPTLQQKVATGFNRAHVTTNEGGSISEEVFMRNVADRAETAGTVFLGLTFNCAQCHDHKYDPLTAEDYYSFYAFFNSLDADPLDGNAAQHPPIVHVPDEQQAERLAELEAEIADAEARLGARADEVDDAFNQWLADAPESWDADEHDPYADAALRFPLDEGEGDVVTSACGDIEARIEGGEAQWEREDLPASASAALTFDGTHLDVGDRADLERHASVTLTAWVHLDERGGEQILLSRREADGDLRGWQLHQQNGRVHLLLVHQWPRNNIRLRADHQLEQDTWHHVAVTYDGSSDADGIAIYIDGEPRDTRVIGGYGNSLQASIRNAADLVIGRQLNGKLADVALFDRVLSPDEIATLAGEDPIGELLAADPDERSDEQRQRLRDHYLRYVDDGDVSIHVELAEAQQAHRAIHQSLPTTLVYRETDEPRQAHLLERGMYDSPGQEVTRRVPETLPPMDDDLPRNRLGLAKWLLSEDQPLTARVTVNRFWQQLFGTGIVRTAEDFGIQGEFPTHPDLLDHLAVHFRESGWDVKDLMRKMVLSATYRQSAARDSDLQHEDPDNRLLARGPRFRLDAEVLRDQALAVSGLLVEKVGGPGVRPPQPEGLWEAVGYTSSNTAQFEADAGPEKVHRRSIYTFWKRTSPPPQMAVFDAPTREACTVRRERTNTPLQALAVMNDVQFVEPARALAERAMMEGGASAEQRARWMFRRVTARVPNDFEQGELVGLYRDLAEDYADDPEAAADLIGIGETAPNDELDPGELAAWTMVANLLLNLDETLNRS